MVSLFLRQPKVYYFLDLCCNFNILRSVCYVSHKRKSNDHFNTILPTRSPHEFDLALEYYLMAADAGDLIASYKLADMYRNGYYVKKDMDQYTKIIKNLYTKIRHTNDLFSPLPEIYTRLSRLYV